MIFEIPSDSDLSMILWSPLSSEEIRRLLGLLQLLISCYHTRFGQRYIQKVSLSQQGMTVCMRHMESRRREKDKTRQYCLEEEKSQKVCVKQICKLCQSLRQFLLQNSHSFSQRSISQRTSRQGSPLLSIKDGQAEGHQRAIPTECAAFMEWAC